MASASPSWDPPARYPARLPALLRPGGLALPDWQYEAVANPYRQLLSANAKYLSAVLASQHRQQDESLDYRVARKCAHLADSEAGHGLAEHAGGAEQAPPLPGSLLHSHLAQPCPALLYLGAPGPIATNSEPIEGLEISRHISQTLEQAAGHLAGQMPTPLTGACPAIAPESSEEQLMLSQQLSLISQLADESCWCWPTTASC